MAWPGGVVALGALAALAVAAPGLATAATDVTFAVPAQATGDAQVAGAEWALLLFRDGTVTGFDLAAADGGTVTNHTVVRARSSVSDPLPAGVVAPTQRIAGPLDGRLTVQPRSWASLYVEARRIDLVAAPVNGTLGRAEPGMNADEVLPEREADGAYRSTAHDVDAPGAWFAFQGDGDRGVRFELKAEGLHRMEWHNVTLRCNGDGPCPTGTPAQDLHPGGGASLAILTYTELQVPDGTLVGGGETLLAALGGRTLGISIDGNARLPAARVQGDCAGEPCPDPAGRTFLGEGALGLSDLRPHPSQPQRLQARLTGAFDARFDESPPVAFGAAAAVAATAVLVAFPLLAKMFAALFARSSRPPALQHPRRQALYDLVRSEPGLAFRGIQRRLGWPNGTLAHHMERLLDAHLVVGRPHRNTVRYFENHGRHDGTWQRTVLLADPNLRSLHEWLAAHPSSSQRDIVLHFGGLGWTRSTTQDRLRALVEHRLVQRTPLGRKAVYVANDGHPRAGPHDVRAPAVVAAPAQP